MNHKTANLIRNQAQNNNNIKQKDVLKDERLDNQINKKSLEIFKFFEFETETLENETGYSGENHINPVSPLLSVITSLKFSYKL